MIPYYSEDGITIYNGDCREILPLLSADFVFDDPPYLDGDWWLFADALMVAGQRVVVTPGATNAWEWAIRHRPIWTYAWASASNSLAGAASFHIGWEPILAFHYPLRPLGTDLLNFSINAQRGTGDHPWPKPLGLIKRLVTHWSNPGDLVLDPHMGSGTTLRAAKDLGRRAIGIEIEERYCDIAVNRLAQGVLAL